jgi:hypothetical protein
MTLQPGRATRIGGVFLAALGFLFLRFSSGFWEENEVTDVIHWGLLPIALLLGAGAWGLEASDSGSLARRDTLWGLSSAVATFAILRIVGIA